MTSSHCVFAGVAGARLSGVCSRVKLCGFGLMSLAGMHLVRSDTPHAEGKYTPYCITTGELQATLKTKLPVNLVVVRYC